MIYSIIYYNFDYNFDFYSVSSTNPTFCPDGWLMYDQACVKLILEPATWTEAQGACSSLFSASGDFSSFKTDLAYVLDDFENNFLTAMFYGEESGFSMNFNGQPGAWLGFSG